MINFIYEWNGRGKYAWSGTPYGIFNALSALTSVENIDISRGIIWRAMRKLRGKILYGDQFGILSTRDGEWKINQKDIISNAPNIVFLEYNSKGLSDSYSYQDLTVDFVTRFAEQNPDMSKFALLSSAKPATIEKRKQMVKKFYSECKGCFTMSKWLANDMTRNSHIPKEKVHFIGGGCNVDTAKIDCSKKNGLRFLFVGKDWERKNGDLVLAAFRRVVDKVPDAELYIAGPEKCSFNKNERNITFLGQLTYEELVKYYNLCDYFVMPSRFEAYGIVFAEALIYGLPCIGKNCFAMPEFISQGKNGFLIERDDAKELAEKMELLIANPQIAQSVIDSRENYIKEYSWDTVAQRMIEVFRKDGYEV